MTSPGILLNGRHWQRTLLLLVVLAALSVHPVHSGTAAGGFLEKATSGEIRARLTRLQIQSLLPARGSFTFPLPYATEGVRLTNAGDCGGTQDCVFPVGYSYWANMNNHVGSDSILIFLGMNQTRGGSGPTLFEYKKIDGTVTVRGPLFDAGSRFRSNSGEGWYFSATMPTALYVMDGSKLLRYDVLSRQFTTVFDAASHMGAGYYIWQTHSSADDRVHIATIRSNATSEMLGCMVYQEDIQRFSYYPERGVVDECHLDRSGRYMVMLDNVDGLYNEDNRIIDIQTGQERTILDQGGAVGHADVGYGYMIGEDDWNALPGAVVLWRLDQPTLTAQRVYSMTDWGAGVGHIAHGNARPATTPAQNFACSSNATRVLAPRANEVVCYRLDSSMDVLVVAPVMTDLNASGGGDDYFKTPKGNLDVTGEYFLWTSNMAGDRVDAFLVRVPSYRLVDPPAGGDTLAPVVALTSPLAGTSASGSVTVSATATDLAGVAGVQFRLDGTALGSEDTVAPYTIAWNTASVPNGSHVISAVARDTSGNTATATSTVSVANTTASTALGNVRASAITVLGAMITWYTPNLSDTQVEYGLTTSYGQSTPLKSEMVRSHYAVLTGLASGRVYHYRVRSRTASGMLALSADFTFTTRPGLAGLWKFEETGGTATEDGSFSNYDGTLMNGTARTAGMIGSGVTLDGVDDYLSVTGDAGLNAYPITVATWVRTSATGLHGVVNKYAASSLNGYQIFTEGGRLCAWYFKDAANRIWDGTSCTMPVSGYNDGLWHHVVLVVDYSGGRLYVDGLPRASRGWTGSPGAPTTTQPLSFGRYPGAPTPHLPGSLDDVRIYNYALSAAEVTALYGLRY